MDVEFRLYYDSKGKVLFYTCEKPEGNYLVIDSLTYAIGNPNVMVKNGKIVEKEYKKTISRYHKSTKGIKTSDFDISIIVPKNYKGTTNKWTYKNVEYN